jgi:hypothetical protein
MISRGTGINSFNVLITFLIPELVNDVLIFKQCKSPRDC